jgi:formylglycine-generating enzyme required for sulfatase activity
LRLCGNVDGGSNPFSDYAMASESQWYNACSAQGVSLYPYGGTYGPSTCNGFDFGLGATIAVQQTNGNPVVTSCVGGAPNLYQMSGNVREWEDSCDAASGQSDSCRTRGGSYLSTELELTCNDADQQARNFVSADLGFRCCL